MSLAHIRHVSPGLTKSTSFNIRTSSNGATEHRRTGCTKTQASKLAIRGRLRASESHSKVTRSLSPTKSPASAKGHSASPTPQRAVNIENSLGILPTNSANINLYTAADYSESGGNSDLLIPAVPDDVGTHNLEVDTAKCAKIVDIIRKLQATRATKRFMGIDNWEYAHIVQALDEPAGGESPLYKARLVYFPKDNELQVSMPDEVHESPFNELQADLRDIIRRIPLPTFSDGRKIVVIRLPGNMQVDGRTISGYPDAQIRIFSHSSSNHNLSYPLPYFLLECSFSQTELSVDRKLAEYAISFPKAVALMKINIKEKPLNYRTPSYTSDVAKQLAHKDLLPWQKWMSKKNESNTETLGPVITHGITWINITDIEVQIWVWSGRAPIDITSLRSTEAQDYAYGTLHPTLDMSAVDKELGVALGRIRDIAVRYAEKTLDASSGDEDESSSEDDSEDASEDASSSKNLNKDLRDDLGLDWTSDSESDDDSDTDYPGLAEARAWSPPNPVFDWQTILVEDLGVAALKTAYRRYRDWHMKLRKRNRKDVESDGPITRSKRRLG